MTTLASAVAIGDNQLTIDSPLDPGQVPGFVEIDDELLDVGGQDNLAGTVLVLSKPAKAAHDVGATVTYAGRPFDPTFKAAVGGSGGEQTIRLLGPYSVTFETPALDTGAIIASLPDNAAVLRVSIFVSEAWGGTTTLYAFIADADLNNWTDPLALVPGEHPSENPTFVQEGYNNARTELPGVAADTSEVPVVLTKTGAKLIALATDAPSDGSADYYVLIAEPAE